MKLRAIVLPTTAALGIGALYWGSAYYAAATFLRAYARGDVSYVDRAFDWAAIVPDLENQVALAFPDPNAKELGKLVAPSFRSWYLATASDKSSYTLETSNT